MFTAMNVGRAVFVAALVALSIPADGQTTSGGSPNRASLRATVFGHHVRPGGQTQIAAERRCEELTVTAREKATWAFWSRRRRIEVRVEGTERPIELDVRNRTPASLRLTGGPMQRVRTSGGSPNRVTLRATVFGRHGRLAIEPVCAREEVDVDGLSRQITDAVATIEPDFVERVAALSSRGVLTPGNALALLDRLEGRLLGALGDPDLAALRAWIEDWISAERERWLLGQPASRAWSGERPKRESATLAGHAAGGPAVLVAAWAQVPRPPDREDERSATSFLGRIRQLFATLRDVASDLTIDLCVRSNPSWADVEIGPKRHSQRRSETTDTDFQNLTRGLYVGTVSWGERSAKIDIDLVSDASNVLNCSEENEKCRREARPEGFVCRRPQ